MTFSQQCLRVDEEIADPTIVDALTGCGLEGLLCVRWIKGSPTYQMQIQALHYRVGSTNTQSRWHSALLNVDGVCRYDSAEASSLIA